jgi:hypothetical protein
MAATINIAICVADTAYFTEGLQCVPRHKLEVLFQQSVVLW